MNELLIATQKSQQDLDPYYNLVSLHLKGDVNTGRTYNAFSDASSNNFRLTNNGDVRGSSFSPYNTSWSNSFNGSSATTVTTTAAFAAASEDFTIECWVYRASITSQMICGWNNNPNYDYFLLGATGNIQLNANNTYTIDTGALSWQVNTWYHIAVSRVSGVVKIFRDGNQVVSNVSNSNSFGVAGNIRIGNWSSTPNYYFSGYISNFRFVKGIGVYTGNFNVPTSPLGLTQSAGTNIQAIAGSQTKLLTCQGNRFIDASGNATSVTVQAGSPTVSSFSPFLETDTTSGSGYFDGNLDYLTLPSSSALTLSGDFRIEFFVYFATTATQVTIWASPSGAADRSIQSSSTNIVYWDGTAERAFGAFVASTWTHIALSRVGSTVKGFYNGSESFSITDTGTLEFSVASLGYRTRTPAGQSLNGYLSSFHIVKGSGVTSIAVPTTPLSPIPNTQLLTLQDRGAYNTIGFQDESEYQHVITRPSSANVAQGTFSPFSNSGWGNYFNGSTAYLSLTATSAVQLTNSTAFAIEFWVYPASIPSTGGSAFVLRAYNISSPYQGYGIAFGGNGLNTNLQIWSGTVWADIGAVSANTWTHIAVTYEGSGSTLRYFINGQQQGSATTVPSSINYTGTPFIIGARNSDFYLNGYISNLRIVKGSAVYTSNFPTPTAPLTPITNTSLLTCQSNRFKDNSSNTFTITPNGSPSVVAFSPFKPVAYDPAVHGGSGYFDGTGDYLTAPDNTAFNLTSGDFTLEAWVYWFGSGTQIIISKDGKSGVSYNQYVLYVGNGALNAAVGSGNNTSYGQFLVDPVAFEKNTWVHVAFVKNGSQLTLYKNGTSVVTAAQTGTMISGGRVLYIGYEESQPSSLAWNGYISNVRIVKGTAVYTSNFTPPSGPLPLLGNTSLLLNFTNGGVIDSTGKNVFETAGTTGVVTSLKKYGSGAMYIPNTASSGSNKIFAPNTGGHFAFGTGDLTIEAWFYLVTLPSGLTSPNNEAIFSCGSNGPILTVSGNAPNANKVIFASYGGTLIIYSTNTISAGVWYYVAVSRASGTTRLYINGVLEGTSTTVEALNASNAITIGQDPVGNNQAFNGYIDDLRITKGYARYTTGTDANANQMVFAGTNTLALPTKALPDRGTLTTLTTEMAAPSTVEALVVAGGGGGGFNRGGGGGAGGYREFVSGNALAVSAGTNYSLTIGGGGPGATAIGAVGVSGSNSVFSTITSSGGGGGGNAETAPNGGNGGSGGGAGGLGTPGLGNKITGTSTDAPTQGNNGGSGSNSAPNYGAGGGGGSNLTSGTGSNGTTTAGGNGGAGTASTITGTSVTYAGGGGGATYNGGTTGLGGAGGGGAAGAAGGINTGIAGTNGLGGGGGGGSAMVGGPASGGSGGSGVVIIAYPTTFKPLKASLGLVYTIDTVTRAGYRVYKFTAGTGTISW